MSARIGRPGSLLSDLSATEWSLLAAGGGHLLVLADPEVVRQHRRVRDHPKSRVLEQLGRVNVAGIRPAAEALGVAGGGLVKLLLRSTALVGVEPEQALAHGNGRPFLERMFCRHCRPPGRPGQGRSGRREASGSYRTVDSR